MTDDRRAPGMPVEADPAGHGDPGVAARFFDGRSSRAHAVWILVADGQARLVSREDGAVLREAPLSALRVSERTRHAPRLVTFADGAYCEVDDGRPFEAVLAATGYRDGLVTRMQNSWRMTALALAGFAGFLVFSYFVLLPAAARAIAHNVPPAIETRLGDSTLKALDDGVLTPSELSADRQQRIRTAFAALRRPDDESHDYRILFRKGGPLGPNALALPGGTIIVTDELVAMAGDGAGLLGVLAHEAGHVVERHGLQQALQASAVATVATYVLGDVSSLLATVPATLLSLRYSREHEREADAYAVDVMRRNGLRVGDLADVLEAMETSRKKERAKNAKENEPAGAAGRDGSDKNDKNDGDDESGSFFSTHPLTRERIEALRGAR